MRRFLSIFLILILLGVAALWASLPAAPGAQAAPARVSSNYLIGTVSGTAYAPDAVGTVRSQGVVNGQLTFAVHLSGLPRPELLGGHYYKVWLVAPEAPLAMPGGVLTWHSDGTADGSFTSTYHDFTVLAVTAEMRSNGAYPQNDKVLDGPIDVAGLQAALANSAPQLAVTQGQLAASSYSRVATGGATGGGSGRCLLK